MNYFYLLKGITYFEDADKNPEPMLLDKTVTWEKVKNFFTTHVKDFEKAFGNFVK